MANARMQSGLRKHGNNFSFLWKERGLKDEGIGQVIDVFRSLVVQGRSKLSEGGHIGPINLAVDLSSNFLSGGGVASLMEFLTSNSEYIRVKNLKFFKNNIDDRGAVAIARYIETSGHALEELHLSHNSITLEGGLELFKAFTIARMKSESSKESPYVYPRCEGGCFLPVWCRLEYNRIGEPEKLLEMWKAYHKSKRHEEGIVCFAEKHIGLARRPSEKDPHCSPIRCLCSTREGGPMLHLYSFTHQGDCGTEKSVRAARPVPRGRGQMPRGTFHSFYQPVARGRNSTDLSPSRQHIQQSILGRGGSPSRGGGGQGKRASQGGSGPPASSPTYVQSTSGAISGRVVGSTLISNGQKRSGSPSQGGLLGTSSNVSYASRVERSSQQRAAEANPLPQQRQQRTQPSVSRPPQFTPKTQPSNFLDGSVTSIEPKNVTASPHRSSVPQPITGSYSFEEQRRLSASPSVHPMSLVSSSTIPNHHLRPNQTPSAAPALYFPPSMGGSAPQGITTTDLRAAGPPVGGYSSSSFPLYVFVDGKAILEMRELRNRSGEINPFSLPGLLALSRKGILPSHVSSPPHGQQLSDGGNSDGIILMIIDAAMADVSAHAKTHPILVQRLKELQIECIHELATTFGVVERIPGFSDTSNDMFVTISQDEVEYARSEGISDHALGVLDFAFVWAQHIADGIDTSRSWTLFLTSEPKVALFHDRLQRQSTQVQQERSRVACVEFNKLNAMVRARMPKLVDVLQGPKCMDSNVRVSPELIGALSAEAVRNLIVNDLCVFQEDYEAQRKLRASNGLPPRPGTYFDTSANPPPTVTAPPLLPPVPSTSHRPTVAALPQQILSVEDVERSLQQQSAQQQPQHRVGLSPSPEETFFPQQGTQTVTSYEARQLEMIVRHYQNEIVRAYELTSDLLDRLRYGVDPQKAQVSDAELFSKAMQAQEGWKNLLEGGPFIQSP